MTPMILFGRENVIRTLALSRPPGAVYFFLWVCQKKKASAALCGMNLPTGRLVLGFFV